MPPFPQSDSHPTKVSPVQYIAASAPRSLPTLLYTRTVSLAGSPPTRNSLRTGQSLTTPGLPALLQQCHIRKQNLTLAL